MVPNIEFPNSPIDAILDFYKRLTGKEVIYDSTVQGQVNVVVKTPVSREDAITIVETALNLNGFALVPGPGNIVKVLGLSKNPRQYAVPIISDIYQLPAGDEVVSFLFKLEYADPTEVQQIIASYIPQSATQTQPIALPKAQTLIVTETANTIRMVARIIQAIDQPPAEVISEFIQLTRADAKDVVDKLNIIFEKPASTTTTTSFPPFGPGGGGPGPGGPGGPGPNNRPNVTVTTLSEDSIISGKIKLTADVRTNRIHVVTRPVNIPFVRRLIAEYDSDIGFGEPTARPLRFVSAADVLDVIVEIMTQPKDSATGIAAAPTPPPRNAQNNANRQASNTSASSSASSTSSANLSGEELSTAEADIIPESRTIGSTRIIADKRTNAIIVLGTQEAKEKIFHVLDQIDIRTPQVMLTAVIGELTLKEGEEFGVDYIQTLGQSLLSGTGTLLTPRSGYAGASRNTGIALSDLASLTTAASMAGLPSGYTGFIGATKSLEIIVHALETSGRFRITSRPMVFTSNNKKAIIASGQEVAVPSNITSGYTGNNNQLTTTANVTYKDIVLKLEVVPLINSEREVTLDIVQVVNSIGSYTIIGGNSVPNVNARRIKTTVSVANEATVVLGGLVQDTKDTSRNSIPILGRIPILGNLFGSKVNNTTRTELVVLLRPTVTFGPEETAIAGERAQSKLNFPPDLEATLDPPGAKINTNLQKPKTVKPKLRATEF